jgi:hypothetical protein
MRYLAELYVSAADLGTVEGHVTRARAAADELTSEGTPVACLQTVFVPEDETCFYLYEAGSPDVVRVAGSRAGITFDRIARAISADGSQK